MGISKWFISVTVIDFNIKTAVPLAEVLTLMLNEGCVDDFFNFVNDDTNSASKFEEGGGKSFLLVGSCPHVTPQRHPRSALFLHPTIDKACLKNQLVVWLLTLKTDSYKCDGLSNLHYWNYSKALTLHEKWTK